MLRSHRQNEASKELIHFLRDKIGLSDDDIKLGQKQSEIEQVPLPIILWNYGLLNIKQYESVLDWQLDNSD